MAPTAGYILFWSNPWQPFGCTSLRWFVHRLLCAYCARPKYLLKTYLTCPRLYFPISLSIDLFNFIQSISTRIGSQSISVFDLPFKVYLSAIRQRISFWRITFKLSDTLLLRSTSFPYSPYAQVQQSLIRNDISHDQLYSTRFNLLLLLLTLGYLFGVTENQFTPTLKPTGTGVWHGRSRLTEKSGMPDGKTKPGRKQCLSHSVRR